METPQTGDSARLSSRQPSAQLGLVERDAELAAVTTLIGLRSDRCSVLVIERPPRWRAAESNDAERNWSLVQEMSARRVGDNPADGAGKGTSS